MDHNNMTGGNFQAPNNASPTPAGTQQANQTQYLFPPNNPQTAPLQYPQSAYNGNQPAQNGWNNAGAQQYNNHAGYGNNTYQNQAPNNNYYVPPTNMPNYGTYAYPQPQKKRSSPLPYILIGVISLCLIAAVALCIYFAMDSDSDERVKRPTPTEDYRVQATTDDSIPTETETETESEVVLPTMAPAAIITEAPQVQTEATEEPENSYEYLDELNRRYDNYFDFQPDENGNIIPDSSDRLLTNQDLHGMTEHQVCMARNEIYARHGYIFQTEKYNEYFENFSWYRPTTTVLPNLSSIEAQNVNFIIAYENERGW